MACSIFCWRIGLSLNFSPFSFLGISGSVFKIRSLISLLISLISKQLADSVDEYFPRDFIV